MRLSRAAIQQIFTGNDNPLVHRGRDAQARGDAETEARMKAASQHGALLAVMTLIYREVSGNPRRLCCVAAQLAAAYNSCGTADTIVASACTRENAGTGRRCYGGST